jgi:CBS domain containing-hemolysin-like protein
MSTDILQLIAYVFLALGFSFLCSVAEAVLLSVTPSYIEELKEKRPKRAALLKRLKQEKVDQALAAILTLNTIAHTVGAMGAGAKATVVFGDYWFGLFSALMTFMILFLSEIIPKTIGAVYWSKLTGANSTFCACVDENSLSSGVDFRETNTVDRTQKKPGRVQSKGVRRHGKDRRTHRSYQKE